MLLLKNKIAPSILVIVVVAGFAIARERLGAHEAGLSSNDLVTAAKKAYETHRAAWSAGELDSIDIVYVWSRRWMDAEWGLSVRSGVAHGAKAHLSRMADLASEAKKRDAESRSAAAAAYYRLEAELAYRESGEERLP